jgi:hypothetical protein
LPCRCRTGPSLVCGRLRVRTVPPSPRNATLNVSFIQTRSKARPSVSARRAASTSRLAGCRPGRARRGWVDSPAHRPAPSREPALHRHDAAASPVSPRAVTARPRRGRRQPTRCRWLRLTALRPGPVRARSDSDPRGGEAVRQRARLPPQGEGCWCTAKPDESTHAIIGRTSPACGESVTQRRSISESRTSVSHILCVGYRLTRAATP